MRWGAKKRHLERKNWEKFRIFQKKNKISQKTANILRWTYEISSCFIHTCFATSIKQNFWQLNDKNLRYADRKSCIVIKRNK